jgi:cation transport ATPase
VALEVNALVGRIRELGFDVALEDRRYQVLGMHCASCVQKVESEVAKVPGVVSATVNLAAGEVRVRSAFGTVSDEAVARGVARAGYRLGQPLADREGPRDEAAPWKRRFVVAAAFTLPVALEMLRRYVPGARAWPHTLVNWVLFAATPVYLGRGFLPPRGLARSPPRERGHEHPHLGGDHAPSPTARRW